MGALEGIEESTKKNPNNKKWTSVQQKNVQTYKIWTPARLKIRKGRELGGNHDMWWPTSWPVSIEDDLFPGPPYS